MRILSTGVETAGEKAYRRLRNDIIFGRLAPSQKLRLEALKDAYGISVSTLRELLNRLTSEGLVVAESARGFEVAPVSADNFKELANLRLLLESHALQRSFVLGDMDWEGRVVAAHHKLATMEGERSPATSAGSKCSSGTIPNSIRRCCRPAARAFCWMRTQRCSTNMSAI